MGEQRMKNIVVAVLLALVAVGLVFARSTKASSASLSDADTLRHLCRDWADASQAIDVKRVSQIVADDWRGVGSTGTIKTKEIALSGMQARNYKLEGTDFGPMDVKVLGNVGVVQGSTTNHLLEDGQHTAYKFAWMDVFERRGDTWVVVRSQVTKLQ
jgi:ketosteroid isomerase-like protein